MNSLSLVTALTITTAMLAPTPTRADLKDALLGVGVGVIASEVIRNNKQNNAKSTTRSRPAGVSQNLNSQYSRGERVQIQEALNVLGYNVGAVDGSLGRNSRRGISEFQAARGEAATGNLTREQFAGLVKAFYNPAAAFFVDRPLNTQEVVLMQQSLQRLGFYNLPIDGSTGHGTLSARNNFLLSQGLNPANTTQVQAVILASSAAGMAAPPYLMQEAQNQYQQANVGAAPNVAAGAFGALNSQFVNPQAPQQAIFPPVTQPQQQQPIPQGQMAAFPTPTPQQQVQPQQQLAPQQGTASLFGTAPAQQQPLAPQTQPVGGGLFAAPAPSANAPVAQPQPVQNGQNILVVQPGAAQQPGATQQPQVAQPQGTALFAAPTQAAPAPVQASSGLDVFAPSGN